MRTQLAQWERKTGLNFHIRIANDLSSMHVKIIDLGDFIGE